MRNQNLLKLLLLLLSASCGTGVLAADPPVGEADAVVAPPSDPLLERGQRIYQAMCAECHGDQGQGDASAYEDPLIGDESIGQLASRIASTMPEGEPEECVGEDAEAVAAYIHHSFYSEAAQLRNRPPRVALARLTADQLRQSLADLYEQFDGHPKPSDQRGVPGIYFDGDRWKNENKKIERVDNTIDFDFGRESPGEGIQAEAFYIHWQGAVRADVTGRYEIVVHSTCSFTMDFGRIGRQLIDNHVQSGDKTEFRRSVMLTAGRVYPFKIDFIQRKRKTELPPARIQLAWVPPGGTEQVIPNRNLVNEQAPATFSLQSNLPPDDRSYGFERGIAINREWDASTTTAAIEFAQSAVDELWPNYLRRQKDQKTSDREKMQAFLSQIVQAAFRGPLSEEVKDTYITKQLAAEPDDAEAIKRVLLVSLKSPRFLYPLADAEQSVSQQVANRLALTLYDSLPNDAELQKLVEKQQLTSGEQVREYARKHVDDYRVQAKTREMLHEWLNVAHFSEISKDDQLFEHFDAPLVSDLRQSLDAFLDEVVWGETSDYRQFFLADWAFTTPRIADFYGADWQPTEKPDNGKALQRTGGHAQRLGLLTHPYLMSGLAYHDSTSPIHRGVFLIRYMLGRTLRPPAEAFSPLSPDLHPDLTTRERVELQTSPESCQVCHVKINGLGFTLENYDAVGRFRQEERTKAIDPAGSYTTRDGQTVVFTGPADVARFLADSDDAQRAFVSRVFQHFVKQPPAAFGEQTLEELTEKFKQSQFSIRDLIVEVAVIAALEPTRNEADNLAQND